MKNDNKCGCGCEHVSQKLKLATANENDFALLQVDGMAEWKMKQITENSPCAAAAVKEKQ